MQKNTICKTIWGRRHIVLRWTILNFYAIKQYEYFVIVNCDVNHDFMNENDPFTKTGDKIYYSACNSK